MSWICVEITTSPSVTLADGIPTAALAGRCLVTLISQALAGYLRVRRALGF